MNKVARQSSYVTNAYSAIMDNLDEGSITRDAEIIIIYQYYSDYPLQ